MRILCRHGHLTQITGTFAYEAVLDQSEIEAINQWVDGGMPSGDLATAPDPPAFNNGTSTLSSIDHTIQIPTYTTQYAEDEYRWFVIPSEFTETMYSECD
jgi:hypothetical protein